MDRDLTDRLKDGVLDLLAREGVDRVTADALARWTAAGKAGIYRRWDTMLDLAAEAIAECSLVPTAPDTGTAAGDLLRLMRPLTRPMGRDEYAAAALLGVAHHHPGVRDALDRAVRVPLLAATTAICDRHVRQGGTPLVSGTPLLARTVTALWWSRYVTGRSPMTPGTLGAWVATAVLPTDGS